MRKIEITRIFVFVVPIVIFLILIVDNDITKVQINYLTYRTESQNVLIKSEKNLEQSYTLKDVIPENLVIKNQASSPSCWAFAMIAALETNLALKDVRNNVSTQLYDFSEMHVEYATTRAFLNGEINKKGYNIAPFQLGMFSRAVAYFTNGFGAVDEKSMLFENYCKGCNNTQDYKIELSDILNKKVTAQVNDTIEFPTYDVIDDNIEDIEKLKIQIKNHIKNYGGVAATTTVNKKSSSFFNYDYSSIYCSAKHNCSPNHAVTIVGWDDNFEVTKFGSTYLPEEERIKPSKPGAWIVKNSYGTIGTKYYFEQIRNIYCTVARNKSQCESNGWDKNSLLIPVEKINEFIEYNKFFLNEDGTYSEKRGEEGYYYISYEDTLIYKNLFGIIDATTDITYDNIYQYNDLGWNYLTKFNTENGKLYLANIFEKDNLNEKEYLTQVSINVPEINTVSVYVNPNGNVLDKDKLKLVQLKTGTSETFDKGYHTLEFLNPIEISGDEFAVVVEIQKNDSNDIYVRLEGYGERVTIEGYETGYFDIPGIADGRGFYSLDMLNWNNFSEYVLHEINAATNTNYVGADTTIKAFTISDIQSIEIVMQPDKVNYVEGNEFDSLGMKVEAISKDGTRIEITDYNVVDGSKLKYGQQTVTINYLGKTATQTVNVEKNTELENPNTGVYFSYGLLSLLIFISVAVYFIIRKKSLFARNG